MASPQDNIISDLTKILTPDLFSSMVSWRLPYRLTEPKDFVAFWRAVQVDGRDARAIAWPALVALSKVGLERMPLLSHFLPGPEDEHFPEQALGLQLLLDQATREFCLGIDTRWTYDYFDHISRSYALWLRTLVGESSPDSWERWEKKGACIEYWVCARIWFGAPLVHGETTQKDANVHTDYMRQTIVKITGENDPYLCDPRRSSIYSFPSLAQELTTGGPKKFQPMGLAEFTYWGALLFDTHTPIIDKFCRYPYLNPIKGRFDTTMDEWDWLRKVAFIGYPSSEVERLLKEDILAGRWTPLGGAELDESTSLDLIIQVNRTSVQKNSNSV